MNSYEHGPWPPGRRIVHVHIPKTAGTAFSDAFKKAYGGSLRVHPNPFESEYRDIEYSDFDFYEGHIGFTTACDIGGEFITILRDPVDRYLSTYFFLKQLYFSGVEISHKTSLAARFDLDEFVQITDDPALDAEFLNRMTWQIAHSHQLELRQQLIDSGVGDAELLRISIANLSRFAIVGVQSDMAGFAEEIRQKYRVKLSIDRINVTKSRLMKADVSPKTLKVIEAWVYLDQQPWDAANGARCGLQEDSGLLANNSRSSAWNSR